MKDRSVQYPKRYRLTKIPGTDDIYDLDPAPGEITEEGTLINKGTLLSDDTAAKFFESLVGTETVDQVLGLLGNYNLHWWRRRTVIRTVNYRFPTATTSNYQTIYTTYDLAYSASLEVNADKQVVLSNPTVVEVTSSNIESLLYAVRGKFWAVQNKGTGNPWVPNYVSSSDAPVSASGGNYNVGADTASSYYSVSTSIGNWEYLQSHYRDTYPDSGESDGYEYQYLGKPLDNAVTAPKISTGSYTGTGTSGSTNPNTLTFDFEPKIIMIMDCVDGLDKSYGSNWTWKFWNNTKYFGLNYARGVGFGAVYVNYNSGYYNYYLCGKKSEDGKTYSWYMETSDSYPNHAAFQANVAGRKYSYFALG